MAAFFKTSTIWIIDFRYEGHPRRWFKAFPPGAAVHDLVVGQLRDLHGSRARLVDLRRASGEEELQYLRGEKPRTALCPTGRGP
jgi:hypothetical protein